LSFLAVLALKFPSMVSASHQTDNPLPTPVPPEPYPNTDIYPAVIYLRTPADLQLLYQLRIDVEGIRIPPHTAPAPGNHFSPGIATIYIDPAQSASLSQAGLNSVPIPNEGYRSFIAFGPGSGAPDAWPSFEDYVARMQALQVAHPEIVALESIGQSVQGRDLWCMQITDHPGLDENESEFKYTANHHGDETTGVEMVMRLAEHLANSYGTDPTLTDMVDKMEIWLCPIYNPDGYVAGSRFNDHNVDLNRNYPDRFTGPPANPQPETLAFMDFENAHRFVMGANYHGGAQVLNYPWDAVAAPGDPIIADFAPDDQLFKLFGIGYTSRNPDLWNGGFPQGITRGWEWYQIWGGMQDWDYYYHNEHHVLIELSFTKSPPFNQMDTYWSHNQDAMLWWMQRAWTGLGGLVLDARDNAPLDASLTLVGQDAPNTILTDPQAGDYHRVISAGTYTLQASADGYLGQETNLVVYTDTVTTHDFYLCPEVPWVVSGTVTDAVSGLPLQATIEFLGTPQSTSSNPDTGFYALQVCPSTYTMRVSAPYHYPEERSVTVDHDQVQDFALFPSPNLSPSTKLASASQALPQEIIRYHLHAENIGSTATVSVTDTLPAEITWAGELTATRGVPVFDAGQILWQGEVNPGQPVTITYTASLNPCLPASLDILNIAEFNDGVNGIITGKALVEVLNAAPVAPSAPSPVSGAVDQPLDVTLSWLASGDLNCDQVSYDLALGTSPTPPILVEGLSEASFAPMNLLNGKVYYWYVIAHDGHSYTISPTWFFITTGIQQKIFLPLASK
jgi:hypothetical protein